MSSVKSDMPTKYLSIVIYAILLLLPFHAFLSTWIGANFGHLDTWRIWKEILIFAAVPLAIWLAFQTQSVKKWLFSSIIAKLLLAYLLLHLIMGVLGLWWDNVNGSALIYGLLANLRFLGLFSICVCLAARTDWLSIRWWRILLIPATIVVGFGLLQLFLPLNFLSHFGYGLETIPAYQTIDQKIDYQRIQSTLRGANPLGTYVLVVITGFAAFIYRKRWLAPVALSASLAALFFTYSRSAWLGTAVSLSLVVWWLKPKFLTKRNLIIGATCVLVIGLISLIALRQNDRFENIFFHTNEESKSAISSNEGRLRAQTNGVKIVVHEPLGQGPGTAGPASNRNHKPPRIAENYYLQIAQEIGIIGAVTFIAIQICLAINLWPYKTDRRVVVILASLAGLAIVNMISHAWTDDTLSLIWWGLAGIVYGDVILNEKRKHLWREKTRRQNAKLSA